MNRTILKSPNCADLKLGGETIEVRHFPDGESYVKLPGGLRGKNVMIIHRCYPEPDSSLMQLFLVLRQAREMGAKRIEAVVPYLPYARQDKRFLDGEAMSSQTVCGMLGEGGCSRLHTFDCHFLKKEGEFTYGGLQIRNMSMGAAVAGYLKKGLGDPIVISPDEGARYLTSGEKDKGVMKKVRGGYKEGENAYREVASLEASFEVKGRDVVIIDDMIAGGSTMVKALKLCIDGGARRVGCGAVHGLFLKDSMKRLLDAGAEKVACSNTIVSDASSIDISSGIKKLL